jgi:replication factor C subunit 2/4
MSSSSLPWIEKYRPKRTADIVLEPNVKREITNILTNRDLPNIIITGTPGVGKTTTLLCIASQLYGKYFSDAVLEINASDDRGIKSVQTTMTDFCSTVLGYSDEDAKKYSPHKLVILDEADNITEKAQHLIGTLMEKFHATTRFAFTCNTSSYIIGSIQSKCKILRYMRIDNVQIINRLKFILDIEKVKYEDDALHSIAYMSSGDMRHAINLTQMTYNRFNSVCIDNVNSICTLPQPIFIKEILLECLSKDFRKSLKHIYALKHSGYTGSDILLGVIGTLKLPLAVDISEKDKMNIINIVCRYLYNISKSMDTDIQLSSCIAELCK